MTHPAVPLALSLLSDQDLRLRMVLDRGDAVAVVVENELVRWHIIVEQIEGRWKVPEYIGGSGRKPPYERPAHAGSPPMLSERQITKSGRPQPDGSPPVASWCVVSGFAAVDARTVTVDIGDDTQVSTVAVDGFVAALVCGRWAEAPRITVETIDGERWPG